MSRRRIQRRRSRLCRLRECNRYPRWLRRISSSLALGTYSWYFQGRKTSLLKDHKSVTLQMTLVPQLRTKRLKLRCWRDELPSTKHWDMWQIYMWSKPTGNLPPMRCTESSKNWRCSSYTTFKAWSFQRCLNRCLIPLRLLSEFSNRSLGSGQ